MLRIPELADSLQIWGRDTVANWVRAAIEQVRSTCASDSIPADRDRMIQDTLATMRQIRDDEELLTLQPVINATGVVLHTNLGRAPLADRAIEALQRAGRYTNAEIDLKSGVRRSRGHQLDHLWRELTGAEASLAVNNCAAATMLALQALAAGREVVVSRGQLIEIGGAYRLPDVFRMSGAILREVGTTNRTRSHDYEDAISVNTAALLRVHPSNFRILGFTECVEIEELVKLARTRSLLAIDDVGSGCITDLQPYGLPSEPMVQDSIRAGADLVIFSGDKLLGGPQSGILLGKKSVIERVKTSPLARAMRIDKLTLAALQATLEIHRAGVAFSEIPALRSLTTPSTDLKQRALAIVGQLQDSVRPAILEAIEGRSAVGGGSLPLAELPTWRLRLTVPGKSADELAQNLRTGQPRVLPRIECDSVHLDLRTVRDSESSDLAIAIRRLVQI